MERHFNEEERRKSKKTGGGETTTGTGTILPAGSFHMYTGACTQPTIDSTNKTENKPEREHSLQVFRFLVKKIALDLATCRNMQALPAVVCATSFLNSQRIGRDLTRPAHQFAFSLRRFSHSYPPSLSLSLFFGDALLFDRSLRCCGTYANVRIFV